MYISGKLKYIKYQKGSIIRGKSKAGNFLSFGHVGLKSSNQGIITPAQIESVRRVVTRYFKRKVKIWIRCYPNLPRTRKPTEVRMGKGKGSVAYWIYKVKPGRILFEFLIYDSRISIIQIKEILRVASSKLSVPTKIIFQDR